MTISMTDVKIGDQVGRQTSEEAPPMWLTVTDVTEDVIYCNRWMFDRITGAEIDHELQWGPDYGKTGSFIMKVLPAVAVS